MKFKRVVSAVLAGVMLVTVAGCAAKEKKVSSNGEEKVVFDVLLAYTAAATTLDNPNDVVTPYVEAKFNMEIGEVTQCATSDIPFQEMLAARIAAGNEPDVIIAANENIAYAVNTGKYGEGLEEYIDKMDNLNKYMDQDKWSRYMIDGKKVQIPRVVVNTTTEEHMNDPYNIPFSNWALWTREDILKACGYDFTPLAEIEAEYSEKGENPGEEAFAITPAIDTPEKLTEYLQKVKDLGIQVGDRELIPMSLINWSQFHVGTMFNFGHWSIDDEKDVNGYLGAKGTKDYYKWLNNANNKGLLDPEFLLQKDDQLQQKVASGLVGAGMMVPDMDSAQEALLESNPEAVIRYIPWPKAEGYTGSFDVYESGFWRATVANDFEYKDRLCELWDWMYSDEGLDILTWGPEEAGLWEIDESGKKVFADKEVEKACLSGELQKKGADYYGIYDCSGIYFPFMSTIAICAPTLDAYNPKSYTRSYDPKLDIKAINRSYSSMNSYNWDGTASYGSGEDEVAKVSNYFWSDWVATASADVITAPEEDFDEVFDKAIQKFYDKSDYDTAKSLMEEWFEEKGPK
ncbi:hypothetical protein GCM10008922_32170 [Faecalicatena contorta]|uniref:hypothetical protein n=1 Tax=Faecalicatena contorta TaxID=39482 RepID=UPI002EC2AE2B|nr:hypothetical protein [Muricomes sp.]